MLSLCGLFFGNFTHLAARLLDSWSCQPPARRLLTDVRLGLHAVTPATYQLISRWAQRHSRAWQCPVLLYLPQRNILKYPTMRRMFLDQPDAPLGEAVMWFDDDSYLDGSYPDFWYAVHDRLATHDVLGQSHWRKGYSAAARRWIAAQPWCLRPVEPQVKFCTGGWWVLRRQVIRRFDWPPPELRHKGGDMLLGELCRQQGLRVGFFDRGVRINADAQGRHSKAERRGASQGNLEREIGWDYQGQPLATDHQDFPLALEIYPPS